jgi:predicted O-methyltransferase YrrM
MACAVEWVSNIECHVRGRKIVVEKFSDDLRTDSARIVLMKTKRHFDMYEELLAHCPPKNIFELGVFEAGSAVILAEMWPAARVIGIDIRKRNEAIAEHLQGLSLCDRVLLFNEISQDDAVAIGEILNSVLGRDLLDIVIDDASHLYSASRRSFEIIFPYVAPGGWYVVEDWGWAHWRDFQDQQALKDEPALSNLIFELVMASASTPDIIARLVIAETYAAVQKGFGDTSELECVLEGLYVSRGRSLNGI